MCLANAISCSVHAANEVPNRVVDRRNSGQSIPIELAFTTMIEITDPY